MKNYSEAANKAIIDIYQGNQVDCTWEQYYDDVREAIQTQAGKWIDGSDHLRAMIALQEVKRLDSKYSN